MANYYHGLVKAMKLPEELLVHARHAMHAGHPAFDLYEDDDGWCLDLKHCEECVPEDDD